MPQPCDSWAEPVEDFAEHKQPQGIRTLARTTFPMWRILNPEYTSTWRWALLKTDDALLMRVLQFAVLLFSPKTELGYDHGDIKHSRLKRFLKEPQAVSLLLIAPGIREIVANAVAEFVGSGYTLWATRKSVGMARKSARPA